jgi:glycosyltransferase involved in cell wall biosynthesis
MGAVPRELPSFGEEELIFSEGGYAPELYEHLREGDYELVVIIGYHSPAAHWGVAALPDEQRIVLVPAMRTTATLPLPAHDELFSRAERILVCTERERRATASRIGADRSDRIENIGFLVGVNALARTTQPYDWSDGDWVVVIGNWFESSPEPFTSWAEELRTRHGLSLRLVGAGAERHELGAIRSASRLDMWRWITRARALFDPTPDRLLGRDVLEAMLFGTPVLVPDWGGATREHAELADGGLWYRTQDEFLAVAGALRDRRVWEALSVQSQAYAEQNFADPDRFIKRISELVLH